MPFFLAVFRALAVLVVLLGLFASGPVAAQLSLPSALPNPVSSSGVRQEGFFYTAPILVDGNLVFRIAAPLNSNGKHIPIVQRQLYIQTALAEVLATHGSGIGATYRIRAELAASGTRPRRRRSVVASRRRKTSRPASYRYRQFRRRSLLPGWNQERRSGLAKCAARRFGPRAPAAAARGARRELPHDRAHQWNTRLCDTAAERAFGAPRPAHEGAAPRS